MKPSDVVSVNELKGVLPDLILPKYLADRRVNACGLIEGPVIGAKDHCYISQLGAGSHFTVYRVDELRLATASEYDAAIVAAFG